MRLKNNQSGIAHLAAILSLIVVVAIGVVGWRVWLNSDKDNRPQDAKVVSRQPEVTSYYQCFNENGKMTPSKEKDRPYDCTIDGKKFSAPTEFTLEAINDLDKVSSQGGKEYIVTLSKKNFAACKTDYVMTSIDAYEQDRLISYGAGCDSPYHGIAFNDKGEWTEVVHTQERLSCSVIDKYKMPTDFLKASGTTDCYGENDKIVEIK